MKKLIIAACTDCTYCFKGMKNTVCTNPKNEKPNTEIIGVNIDNSIADFCKLEDA